MSRYELSEKSLRKLKILEKKYPIDSLKYRNINIFPLIRLILSRQSFVEKKNVYYNKILSKFFTVFKVPKFYFEKIKFDQTLKKLNNKKIELIFFSDHLFHYDKIKDKKVNLFIDPYFEAVKKKYKSLKVEIVSNNFKKSFNKKNEPFYLKLFYLDIYGYLKKSLPNFFNIEKKFKIEGPNTKILNSTLNSSNVNKMMNNFDKIIFDSKKIESFLKEINPKAVFLTCYYSYQNLAIILACKKLGIPSVDIQHGGHELYHLMYSHWNKMPTKGYELLPDYFWIWGKNQKNSGIFNNLKTKHKYVIGGKTQLDFWERNKKFLDEDFINEQKKFLKKKKNHKKIVLFSATFTDIPKIIFPLIKQSPKNWLWLIRAHPRHSNLEEIKLQFKKKGISNVEIDFPSLSSLNFLLKNISHLIVEFSSVVYDALYFNVPSVVLQKNYSHFKNNITNKNLKFSVNKNEIIKFIKNRTVHIKYEKIVSGKKFACNAVKKIIKN